MALVRASNAQGVILGVMLASLLILIVTSTCVLTSPDQTNVAGALCQPWLPSRDYPAAKLCSTSHDATAAVLSIQSRAIYSLIGSSFGSSAAATLVVLVIILAGHFGGMPPCANLAQDEEKHAKPYLRKVSKQQQTQINTLDSRPTEKSQRRVGVGKNPEATMPLEPRQRFVVVEVTYKASPRQRLITLRCHATDRLSSIQAAQHVAVPVCEHFGSVQVSLKSATLCDAVNQRPVGQDHLLLLEGGSCVVLETDVDPIGEIKPDEWKLQLQIKVYGVTVKKNIYLHGNTVTVV